MIQSRLYYTCTSEADERHENREHCPVFRALLNQSQKVLGSGLYSERLATAQARV
jgi:hypothetical protein